MCRKVRFPDELGAKIALASAQAKGDRGQSRRDEKRIYPCPVCSGWHLTSKAEWYARTGG